MPLFHLETKLEDNLSPDQTHKSGLLPSPGVKHNILLSSQSATFGARSCGCKHVTIGTDVFSSSLNGCGTFFTSSWPFYSRASSYIGIPFMLSLMRALIVLKFHQLSTINNVTNFNTLISRAICLQKLRRLTIYLNPHTGILDDALRDYQLASDLPP